MDITLFIFVKVVVLHKYLALAQRDLLVSMITAALIWVYAVIGNTSCQLTESRPQIENQILQSAVPHYPGNATSKKDNHTGELCPAQVPSSIIC